MSAGVRSLAILIGLVGLVGLAGHRAVGTAGAVPAPRPGLTAQQTKQAVELAQETMQELRKKTEGATEPEADRREYIVNVELLNSKEPEPTARRSRAKSADRAREGPRSRPATRRRRDVLSLLRRYHGLLDRRSGDRQGRGCPGGPAHPDPLSDGEYEEAIDVAREQERRGQAAVRDFGEQLTVYPQFSQFT